jgi:dTDP-4-dehydrorhamnose reductase
VTGSREKILVTGFPGQLARAVQSRVGDDAGVFQFVSSHELDITDKKQVDSVLQSGEFRWVLNAAAYTAVDRAEQEPVRAALVNGLGPHLLAEACKENGARLAHVSTDFVFEGNSCTPIKPDEKTSPVSEYGRSKLAGEEAVLAISGEDALIVRTAWVYSSGGQNFVTTMLRLMRERDSLRVVADQIGSPTWANTLAEGILHLMRENARGIYHLTDAGVASWYDFAVAIQELAIERGLLSRAIEIEPVSTADYLTPARRPAYSVLDKASSFEILGGPTPHWRASLARCLDNWSESESP